MALDGLRRSFAKYIRGQGATEYLVILGAVLLVSIVVVSAMSSSTTSQSSMKQQQSQAYWSGLSPIKVLSSKVVDSNLVLQLQNTGSATVRLDDIRVGGTALPIYPYGAGDYYGPAYCSRPNDNFSATMTCALLLGPGETAYVAAQGAISGSSPVVDCAGKASTEVSNVQFAYSLSSSSITNIILKGDKPLVTSCGVKTCDTNWSKVPGNSSFLVNDFCLMTYEARVIGGVAVSTANGTGPNTTITQATASALCSSLGAGYHLIRDREWVVAANNVASVAANWNSSVVGVGSLKQGNNGRDTGVSYNAAVDPDNLTSNSTAQLFLSNGESVWHFSGNVAEWTDGGVFEDKTGTGSNSADSAGITGGQLPTNGTLLDGAWLEYVNITNFNAVNYSRLPNASWNSTQGVGQIYINPGYAFNASGYVATTHAFRRGGAWGDAAGAGVWGLFTLGAPSLTYFALGFRCAR